ncbi:N-acetylglutaminylglutamine synthetase [Cerasicoccus arenae]|uniref:Acetyltransferase n=1 Tax=Cerasicoccus arenae TaxID=424488 RepID=A0A8J3DE34_9BACT|nr:N-acetylglutaminylglutamine synthetase [Cerasicoccus arenae]MBK1857870.1 N-acetylglutaminylglutamine synthetase [Cerasicoccus arenae]GHC09362.1 acetyltransferase [Cerasicoccus arenae]
MDTTTSKPGTTLQCGWGRLMFADTFPSPESLAAAILSEHPEQRDIALYLLDPHLVLNCAPQQIFLDPSNTYRLLLSDYKPSEKTPVGFEIRKLAHKEELDEINRIYTTLKMVPLDKDYVWDNRHAEGFTYFIAVQNETGHVLGVAMGANHQVCGEHMPNSCSLWAVGVDPQAQLPGVGTSLVRHIIEHYSQLGREYMDVSVIHDNENAQRLYEKMGFERMYIFAAKRRNRINERLFVGAPAPDGYNPYATIIINEALRRGIAVDPISPERNYFRLSLGGRSVTCWESLTTMTSAIALKRAEDKQFTHEVLKAADLSTPDQILAGEPRRNLQFLNRHKSVVVKPLVGEQGQGISVDVRSEESLEAAVEKAREFSDVVLIEQFVEGQDLRVIVINQEVVAAAVRRPPSVIGTGEHTIRELIEKLSRRREAATGGESKIPLDKETERCVRMAGYALEDVLEKEVAIPVRKTANLHTGGTIHDVTDKLHPTLAEASIRAAAVLEMPVVGLDLMVKSADQPDYVIIEGNERPGLANHEPQPTAEKFIDFLFPQSIIAQAAPPVAEQ